MLGTLVIHVLMKKKGQMWVKSWLTTLTLPAICIDQQSCEMTGSTTSWKNIMKSCCDHRICDHNNQMEGRSNKFTQLSRNISWKNLDQNISGDNDWVLRIFNLLCLCLHFLLLQVLLCDLCNSQWHMSCLKIPLTHVPEGQWQCPDCSPDLCDGPGRTKLLTERYLKSFNPWGNGFLKF